MTADDANGTPGRRGLAGRIVDAVVSPIVAPVVDAVDVSGVVDRVDVEAVIERIDLDALVARIDLDAAVQRIDLDGALGRVDVNRVLDRIDPDRLLDRVDVERVLDRVDVNRVLDRVDVERVLDRVDPDRLLDRVDPNRLLDRVEPDRLLDRVDVERVLDRVDVERLLDRVDVERLLDRVDVDRLMARVDVNDLVRRTELGAVIARSTTGVFGELLDAARGVSMTVDLLVQGAVGRVVRPGREQRPGRPGAPDDVVDVRAISLPERGVALQGHHAGSVSRFLAFLLDQFLIGVLFAGGQALLALAIEVVTGRTWEPSDTRWLVVAGYVLWWFVYLAVSLAAVGRTIGMSVLGLQVVGADGSRLEPGRAVGRTVAFPFSFVLGIGLLIGLVRRDRRELHDLVAGTAVIYAWDAELARMRARGPIGVAG